MYFYKTTISVYGNMKSEFLFKSAKNYSKKEFDKLLDDSINLYNKDDNIFCINYTKPMWYYPYEIIQHFCKNNKYFKLIDYNFV